MAPAWIVAGALVLLVSVSLFAWLSATLRSNRGGRTARLVEPVLLALAGLAGVALEYPSILRHPGLTPIRELSVGTATWVLLALTALIWIAFGWCRAGARGGIVSVFAGSLLVLAVWRLARPPALPDDAAGSSQTVLLGIDSLAQTDDIGRLRQEVERLGGVWYEKPVPPGLLTNSVWPAIVLDRPVSETGVFFVYQTPDWKGASFNMIERARRRGCRTVAHFSSQITFYLGSNAGFDVDRSGPRGWLHFATAFVKDGSVFLPIILPRLGSLPFAVSPVNQSGTFAYDLRREVHDILTVGASEKCAFVAAHLDYLHENAYPPFSEMTPTERQAVRSARVSLVQDLALHWQPPVVTGDPLEVEKWKLAYLQKAIVAEIERSHFLGAEKKNRLILFSDHGKRRRIQDDTFGDPRYHRVLFATFGVPARAPERPISLLDISSMLGYADPGRKDAEPMVEYTNVTGPEWQELIGSARLQSDGRVLLDPTIVKRAGARLKGFRPYAPGGYFPSPLRRDPPR